jgi:hypothetical protein
MESVTVFANDFYDDITLADGYIGHIPVDHLVGGAPCHGYNQSLKPVGEIARLNRGIAWLNRGLAWKGGGNQSS